MCAKLEAELEGTEVPQDSKLTVDQVVERLSQKGWTKEEVDSFISKYDDLS